MEQWWKNMWDKFFNRSTTRKLSFAEQVAVQQRAKAFVERVWLEQIQPDLDLHKEFLRIRRERESVK